MCIPFSRTRSFDEDPEAKLDAIIEEFYPTTNSIQNQVLAEGVF